MLSHLRRSATRSGWRGVALLGLLPMVVAALLTALCTRGAVRSVAGDVYCVAAGTVFVLAWQISFGGRDV